MQHERIQQQDVIELFKLALYDDHTTSSTVAMVQEQLRDAGHDLDELITKHIRCLIEAAKEKVSQAKRWSFMSKEEIENMQVGLFIGVPQVRPYSRSLRDTEGPIHSTDVCCRCGGVLPTRR